MNVEGCQRFIFGDDSFKRNCTFMVLGATGAGKSTLINRMINYIMGVTWDDTFRFKLVDEDTNKYQAYSQTSEVTVYKLNHREGFQIDYSLTIVDTPGFGHTGGKDKDLLIVPKLQRLFSAKHGVSEIDAICFVAQASLARLTESQKHVFNSMLNIFGKDVAENIRILVTFSDGTKPPVLEAIKEAEVPWSQDEDGSPIHFKFNNSDEKLCGPLGECPLSAHFRDGFYWGSETVKEKRTYKEMKEKYEEASKAAMSVGDIIKQMEQEYDCLKDELVRLLERAAQCLNTLKEIALKPDPLSIAQYIDLLIEGEFGYPERKNKLLELKKKATTMEIVASEATVMLAGPQSC
ncbi:unnamed protein product [Boreogadus saida]